MKNKAKLPTHKKKWSDEVTKNSIALDLEKGVFTWNDPKKIAASLKHSADVSIRRNTKPFQSAMSMLNSTSTAREKTSPMKEKSARAGKN